MESLYRDLLCDTLREDIEEGAGEMQTGDGPPPAAADQPKVYCDGQLCEGTTTGSARWQDAGDPSKFLCMQCWTASARRRSRLSAYWDWMRILQQVTGGGTKEPEEVTQARGRIQRTGPTFSGRAMKRDASNSSKRNALQRRRS